MFDRKCRVSDKVLTDAVHRLALMCVEQSIRESHLDPVEFPNLVADLYCNASEMIRTRINYQRMSDGTNTECLSVTDRSKIWFEGDVTELICSKHEKVRRP